jgi:hypothetical protein
MQIVPQGERAHEDRMHISKFGLEQKGNTLPSNIRGCKCLETYDVLLIYPPRFFGKDFLKFGERACYLSTPMGLFGIADLLEKKGFSAKILNIPLEIYINKNWKLGNFLKSVNAKIYAVSLHWILSSYGAIETARICKKIDPSAKVVFGGLTASYFDLEIVTEFPFVDCIVRGDGELPLVELAGRSSKELPLNEVSNLTFRRNKEVVRTPTSYVPNSIDHMSFARLESLQHWGEYLGIMRQTMGLPFSVAVGRGCPFNCPFCGGGQKAMKTITGRKTVVLRSVEKVVEDIKTLVKIAGVKSIYFGHGAYPQSMSYWRKLFQTLKEEKLGIGADLEIWRLPIDRTFLDEFSKTFDPAASSLSFVTYPRRVRTLLGPLTDPFLNYDEKDFHSLVDEATSKNISLRLWFTVGNPFETIKDILENLASIAKALSNKERKRGNIAFYNTPVTISPGSPAFETPRGFGIDLEPSSFMDFYTLFKNSRFTLGEVDNVVNYRTQFLSKRAIKFWNEVLTVAALPFFLTTSH